MDIFPPLTLVIYSKLYINWPAGLTANQPRNKVTTSIGILFLVEYWFANQAINMNGSNVPSVLYMRSQI